MYAERLIIGKSSSVYFCGAWRDRGIVPFCLQGRAVSKLVLCASSACRIMYVVSKGDEMKREKVQE